VDAKHAVLSTAEQIQCWLKQKEAGVALGYAGLRCSGNISFLDELAWKEFMIYEQLANEAFRNERIIGLCNYEIDACSAGAVADVMQCHRFGLAKRHGRWKLIETRSHDHNASALAGHNPNTSSRWHGGFRRLMEDQLAIYMQAYPERIALRGRHVLLSESQASKLGPLFNELVTNAARNGALSSAQGKLVVQWRVVANGSRNLHIKWSESGISSYNIARSADLMANVLRNCKHVFDPRGMECTFDLTLDTRAIEVRFPFK